MPSKVTFGCANGGIWQDPDEWLLNLPVALLPAQPNWAERCYLTGFHPAWLVWPLPCRLLARQLYFLVLLAAALMWDEPAG